MIGADVEFQVAIPTQVAVFGNFISLEDQPRLVDEFERQLAGEVAKILAAVPRDELAIQWDVAMELAVIEGVIDSIYDTEGLLDQVGRMAAMVPDDVSLGFHLCYGDAPIGPEGAGRHFVQPKDTGNLVMVATGLFACVARPVAFLHMPVRSTGTTTRTSRRSRAWRSRPTPSCTSASCITRTGSPARVAAWPLPRATSAGSAWRPNAGCRTNRGRRSRSCCASSARSKSRPDRYSHRYSLTPRVVRVT